MGGTMASLLPCPVCSTYHFYRSSIKNLVEKIRTLIFFQKPYRCHECGYRGWIQVPIKFPELTRRRILILCIIVVSGFVISQFLIGS